MHLRTTDQCNHQASAWKKVTAIVLLILSAIVSGIYFDKPSALWIAENINDNHKNLIWFIGRPGRFGFWLTILAFIALLPRLRLLLGHKLSEAHLQLPFAATYLTLTMATSSIVGEIIKILVGRTRPHAALRLGVDHVPFSLNSTFHSLPSGHSLTAWAAIFALSAYFPRFRAPLWILGISTMLCRVLMNRHYISDTLAGCAIALGCTIWCQSLLSRLVASTRWDKIYAWLIPNTSSQRSPTWIKRLSGRGSLKAQ